MKKENSIFLKIDISKILKREKRKMESNKQTIKEEIKRLNKASQNKYDFDNYINNLAQETSSLPYNPEFIGNFQEQYFLPQINPDNFKESAEMFNSLVIGIGDNISLDYIDEPLIRYRTYLLERLEENLENSVSNNEKEKIKDYTKSVLDFGARRGR